MTKSFLIVFFFVTSLLGKPSLFDEGKRAFDSKKYVKAFELFKKSCDQKNADGCFYIGWMYEHAVGTKKDYFKAIDYYRSVCDKNHALGCNNLGAMYENGTGIRQDSSEALRYYIKACEKGVATACDNIGNLYSNGAESIDKDKEEAILHYSKACDLGRLQSCMNLGSTYFDFNSNNASAENQEKAYIIYMKVCDKGTASDCYNIGFKYEGNYNFDGDEGKASEFFKKSCEKGDKRGCKEIAWEHYTSDRSVSAKYFLEACEYGDKDSCYMAGRMHYYGEGNAKQDITKATLLYKKACKDEKWSIRCDDGMMQDYAHDLSTEEYVPQAVQFYTQRCNDKNAEACYSLGQMYYEGRGIQRGNYQSKNWKQAKYFYGKACDLKYSKGCERYNDLREY